MPIEMGKRKSAMPSVKLYGKKEIRMAAYNRSASGFYLKLAEKNEDGRFYSAQASIVFSAFTYEAFLNTLGSKLLNNWGAHDRENIVNKLKTICDKLGYKPLKNKRPYQSLKKLIWFRNLTAHGREEIVTAAGKPVSKQKKGEYHDAIESEWEKYCTVKNARKVYEDVNEIAKDLCQRADIRKIAGFPFGSLASSIYTVKKK